MTELCCEYLSVRCIWLHVLVMSRTRYRVNSHCLNVKELLARSRCEAWSLSDCNWTRTHNHLAHNRTPNHLAKPAKWPKWFRACFEQRVPWHSGNYRVWIHSITRTWLDKNIQSIWILISWTWWVCWDLNNIHREKRQKHLNIRIL